MAGCWVKPPLLQESSTTVKRYPPSRLRVLIGRALPPGARPFFHGKHTTAAPGPGKFIREVGGLGVPGWCVLWRTHFACRVDTFVAARQASARVRTRQTRAFAAKTLSSSA